MKLTVRQLTVCALLAALALGLSYLERMIPLGTLIPLPGIKLGLANIVTLFALLTMGTWPAFLILLTRCLLGAVFAGNLNALLFSLLGGVLAMTMMALLKSSVLSVYGISVAGAACHQLGQVLAAALVLASWTPMAYLPLLLLTALMTGGVTGAVTALLLKTVSQIFPEKI